jgi:ferredoxin
VKITVDKGLCIGAGNCVEVAPDLFGQDPVSGVAEALVDDIDGSSQDDAELAADVCPVAAIMLR